MEEAWRQGEASVRAVMEPLNDRAAKTRAYTTYMTIMSRLHRKGLLTRRRDGKTDFYKPAYAREQYLELRAQAEVEAMVDEFGDVALAHFVKQVAHLAPERLEELQRLARTR